ncbi:MAG: hypothetical protein QM773_21355 [Hyphomonadaceae bacterium]
MAKAEEIVEAAVLKALEQGPGLMPHEIRYADYMKLRLEQVGIAQRISRELVGRGYFPFEVDADPRGLANFHAVTYTMGQMRTRLLRHIRGGGRDPEAERLALQSIATAFFGDLESRGWRLVYTRKPAEHHSTSEGPLKG